MHFGKDQPWNGMTVIDLIFEASDRWLLAEPLAYDLYHRAGLAACRTDFFRLTVDGQCPGRHQDERGVVGDGDEEYLRRPAEEG